MKMKTLSSLVLLIFLTGCFDFPTEAMDNKFGDQHFKTAISLIELHKIRYGEYPESLEKLKFTGDWDAIIYHSVEYTKEKEGYKLIVTQGFTDKPNLNYPDEFYQGLGMINRLK